MTPKEANEKMREGGDVAKAVKEAMLEAGVTKQQAEDVTMAFVISHGYTFGIVEYFR